ncbi:MAG: DUF4132 domain-containing protein [Algicola sp.]|nr:DUF4132 domain-containing protein [Algicola sp.]
MTEQIFAGVDLSEVEAPLDNLLTEMAPFVNWHHWKLSDCNAGDTIRKMSPAKWRLIVLLILQRVLPIEDQIKLLRVKTPGNTKWGGSDEGETLWKQRQMLVVTAAELMGKKLPLQSAELQTLLDWVQRDSDLFDIVWTPIAKVIKLAENYKKQQAFDLPLIESLTNLQAKLQDRQSHKKYRALRGSVENLLNDGPKLLIQSGEAWSDQAIKDLQNLKPQSLALWVSLLEHCKDATSAKPSPKWSATAAEWVKSLTLKRIKALVLTWLPLVDKPRTNPITSWSDWDPDPNKLIIGMHMDILRGLVWIISEDGDDDTAKAFRDLAISCYKKVPGLGPRAIKLGNACVYGLGEIKGMIGVNQLALLKVRVTFRTALKGINKALEKSAFREGKTSEELEEMGVPAYGLTDVGFCRESMGDFVAELSVGAKNSVDIVWIKADGTQQKSVPAWVKENAADDLKALKTNGKDIQKMLPAQKQRIEGFYLKQKSWPLDQWRDYYLNHPLVGFLARRLIWTVMQGDNSFDVIWHDNDLVQLDGAIFNCDVRLELELGGEGAVVSLWHPLTATTQQIVAWRDKLERLSITQPFKQAHREIYLLNDAERQTANYSNRFAAHLLKQHQLSALAAVRGWQYSLQGAWDAPAETVQLKLAKWGIFAEYRVAGVGEVGEQTTEAGVYHYVVSDQVRFYADHDSEVSASEFGMSDDTTTPIGLAEIPELVFSEVFRDVDLYVGVCSVGNDPQWEDGGLDARYQQYWRDYGFGELGTSAQTRKTVLERLLPRLKIAEQCELSDRYLIVKGELRTYKIHLGSTNILMMPDDQYLCIVPGRGKSKADDIFLPFEGDNQLSLILSKAFLLAADGKIKDQTILTQINGR